MGTNAKRGLKEMQSSSEWVKREGEERKIANFAANSAQESFVSALWCRAKAFQFLSVLLLRAIHLTVYKRRSKSSLLILLLRLCFESRFRVRRGETCEIVDTWRWLVEREVKNKLERTTTRFRIWSIPKVGGLTMGGMDKICKRYNLCVTNTTGIKIRFYSIFAMNFHYPCIALWILYEF